MKQRKKHSPKKRIILICALALLAAVLTYIVCEIVSIIIYSGKDETRPADCIIVLGAAVYGDTPSPVFRERIEHGIRLYSRGMAGKIIFTGGKSQENDMAESEAARKYALERGIPEDDIFIETESSITQENLANAKDIMDREGFRTALVVSDPLHMRRAMTLASYYMIEAYSCPTDTSMYRTPGTKIPFLLRESYYYIGFKLYRIFHPYTPVTP